jgi:hypothetical protein
MKTIILAVLTFVPTLALADQTTQPRAYAVQIYNDEIIPKSTNSQIVCEVGAEECALKWTPKAGQTISFADRSALRAAARSRLHDLLVKFRADPLSITAAEQREAVFKTVALVLADE